MAAAAGPLLDLTPAWVKRSPASESNKKQIAPLIPSIPKIFFDNKNIFMLNGHGGQLLDSPYFDLKPHQNALIPGVCGSKLKIKDDLYFSFFRKDFGPIDIFTKYTNDDTISKKINLNYTIEVPLPDGGTHQITDIQQLKRYYGAINVPNLYINPISSNKYSRIVDGVEYFLIHIEPSGILRQTEPTEMEIHDEWLHPFAKPLSNKYTIILEYNPDDLNLKLEEIENMGPDSTAYRVLYTIKDSLKDSVLTYKDILALAILYKYGTTGGVPFNEVNNLEVFNEWSTIKDSVFFRDKYSSLVLNDLFEENLHIQHNFYFDFLDSVTAEPYLLISMTCRHVTMPRIPNTPSKKAQVIQEIEEKHKKVSNLRRLSRTNLLARLGNENFLRRLGSGGSTSSLELLNSPPPAAAAGAGGGVAPMPFEEFLAAQKFERKQSKYPQIKGESIGLAGIPSSIPTVGLPSVGLAGAVGLPKFGLAAAAKSPGLGGRRRTYRRRSKRRVLRRLRRTRRRLRR